MTANCPYCGLPATENVPENPSRVCVAHATEYWTSLMAYVRTRPSEPVSRAAERPVTEIARPRRAELR